MKLRNDKKKFSKNSAIFTVRLLLFTACCLFFAACQPDQRILNSQNSGEPKTSTNTVSAPTVNDFERDIKSMQTANFDFIYVFRRKDGGKLTTEDKKFAKANSPFDTNRFIVTDEETAIIAGSNTRFASANLEALKSGFVVADFSKPESELKIADVNANAANKTIINNK